MFEMLFRARWIISSINLYCISFKLSICVFFFVIYNLSKKGRCAAALCCIQKDILPGNKADPPSLEFIFLLFDFSSFYFSFSFILFLYIRQYYIWNFPTVYFLWNKIYNIISLSVKYVCFVYCICKDILYTLCNFCKYNIRRWKQIDDFGILY